MIGSSTYSRSLSVLVAWALAFSVSPVAIPPVRAAAGTEPGASAAYGAVDPSVGRLTGSVVIAYEETARSQLTEWLAEAGATVVNRSSAGGFVVAEPGRDETPEAFAARAARLPGVRYAEQEKVIEASWTPDDPDYADQWNLARVGAEAAWDVERGDASVVVAVVDSGVDLEHPDLAGQLADGGYDFVDSDREPADEFGHGTHVAGVIAAGTNNGLDVAGLANGCTVLPVRVLDENGDGSTALMAEGIRFAADAGADIINVSAGGPDSSRVLLDAVEHAIAEGCIVVAAAGNRGGTGLDYPAAYPDVVAVGGTDVHDSRASFSRAGSGLDIVAPGDDILSLRPTTGPADDGPTGFMSGTSMSTPHVSAAAALLRSANPTWTAPVVVHRLLASAEDLGARGRDDYYGYGLLRTDLALGVGTSTPAPPSDDELPGMPIPGSPVTEIVDSLLDPVDVYSIALAEAQSVRLWLRGTRDATITLSVLEPRARGVDDVPLASVTSTGGSQGVSFTAPEGEGGDYRLVVRATGGSGEYSLAWLRGYPTAISAGMPSTCVWGGTAVITGSVVDREGAFLPDVRVVLDAKPAGSRSWLMGVTSTTADDSGIFQVTVRPSRRMYYRVRFEGMPGELASTSRTMLLSPRAALGAPSVPVSARSGSAFSVFGTIRPKHPEGERSVRVVAYREESGRWVARRSVWATNQDRDGYTRYFARVALPAGRWRLVASVAADNDHAATVSVPSYLTVQ